MRSKLTRLNIGIKIGREIVSIIRFSDDTVMIAESKGDIQSALDELNEMLKLSEI